VSDAAPARPFRGDRRTELGITKNGLRSARYRRLGQSVYAPSDLDLGLVEQVAAALLVLPADAVVTGPTALHLYRVEVGDPLPVRAVTATRSQTRRAGIRLIRAQQLPPRTRRLASPVAAWLAACSEFDLLEAVTAGDWLVDRRLASVQVLVKSAAGFTGRGARMARRAAGLVVKGAESPQETRLRLALVLSGLPTPRCNITLGTDEYAIGRVDMLLEEFKLILEYDGDRHRLDRSQWNLDLDRNDAFADEGYLTVRVTSARMRRPRDVVRRVHAKLVERGYQGPAPVFNDEWRALFE
jgi:hypothetical protein